MSARRDDDGNMLTLEAILVGLLLFGGLYYVISFGAGNTDSALARNDIRIAGADALTVLSGLVACDLLTGDERTACENVYGQSLLKRHVTEALVGDTTDFDLKMKTLMPPGVQYNVYLDNSVGTLPLLRQYATPGERVTAALAFTPEWNHTAVATQRSNYAGTPGSTNPMVVYGLPVWKSRAVDLAAADPTTLTYEDGTRTVALDNVVVDGSRGNLSTMAWWRMNENAGTTLENVTRDAAGAVSDAGLSARWVDGRTGSGVSFSDSDNDLVTSFAGLSAERVTMMAWMYPTALPNDAQNDVRLLLWESDQSASETLEIRIAKRPTATGDALLYARFHDAGTATTVTATGTEALVVNRWYHVAVTYGDGSLTLYLDGDLEATADSSLALTFDPASSPAELMFGGWVDSVTDVVKYNGRLDEVRLYRRVLAEDEFSEMRWGLATNWDDNPNVRGLGSDVTRGGIPLTGSTQYRVEGATTIYATESDALTRAVRDSHVAAYRNGTWSRDVPIHEEVAIEYDFRPVFRHLRDEGIAVEPGTRTFSTVSVRSPVSQPYGYNAKSHELYNATFENRHGYANFTLPKEALFGAHVVVVTLNVTLEDTDGTARPILLRQADYFNVVHPLTQTVSVNPVYRVVLEMWVPEWR